MPPATRFCSGCGTPATDRDAPATVRVVRLGGPLDRTALLAAAGGAVLLGFILVMLLRRTPVTAAGDPEPGAAFAGAEPLRDGSANAPPDISAMTPRERFDRLYNRIMRAAESGDQATAGRFTPMALAAYASLPDVDADARYHAALLKAHTGDAVGAKALGDSILAIAPGHLFGYMALGAVARWEKDDRGLAAAYRGFLSHYDAEMKAKRAEYEHHALSLDAFRRAAQGGGGSGTRGAGPGF
jgi:hypothetical protein